MKSWISSRVGDGSSSCNSHANATIPAAAKKVVQNLREIVKKHSDEEIYATLKECDMDPNHAVHVLMNQDAFHEVKRKRFKRREIGWKNDAREIEATALGNLSKLDRGKRVNYTPRHSINDRSRGDKYRTKSLQEDRSSNHGTVESASFKLSNQMRNIGMGGGSSLGHAAVPTPAGIGSVATLSQSSLYTGASSDHGAATSRGKPVKRLDRADRKWGERPFNVRLADASALRLPKMYKLRKVVPVIQNSARLSSDSRFQAGGVHETVPGKGNRTSSARTAVGPYLPSYQSNRVSYRVHQQAPNRQKKALEWKPKAIVVTAEESFESVQMGKTGSSPVMMELPVSIEVQSELFSKLEGLNLLDDPPVIIPEHLRVPEEECAGLNFGSFGTDFELSFTTEPNDRECLPEGDIHDICPVPQLGTSVTDILPVETSTSDPQPLSPTLESFTTTNDAVLTMLPVAGKTTELGKPEVATQGRQFTFISSASNEQNLGVGSPQSLYPYDIAETQLSETSRPSFTRFADPSPDYFNPVARPSSEVETPYQFLSLPGASKFGGNFSSANVQTITSSQELSQNAGMPHTTLAVGQPSIPVHAYAGAQPAGVTIPPYPTNIYGYQYVASNYAYMHAPYQTSYPGNSGYLQPPIGSNFAPSGRVYPSVGSNAVKFPPAQYKLGTGSAPHAMVAAGYGSFQSAHSGFAGINSGVTTGSATSYDGDMIGPQYKENALYSASQQVRVHNFSLGQVEASPLWVQSRDVSGMQANSFYNVHGPGQHAGYMPSQPAHGHHAAGFASYSQSVAPGPNNHQLLQQPQSLGSVGAGSHAVMFSQPQRGPVNWTSNYSNLIRS